MKNSNNIDNIYRETLKNVETTPPEAVWRNISSQLPKKEPKKSLVPLFYRIAGIAAVLALLFGLYKNLFTPSPFQQQDAITFSKEDIYKEIDLAATGFHDIMLRSAGKLQTLIQHSRKIDVPEQPNTIKRKPLSEITPFAGMSEEPNEIEFTDIGYSHLDFTLLAPTVGKPDEQLPVSKSPEKKLALPTNAETQLPTEKSTDRPSSRLRISTRIAPVYFDQMGSGNFLSTTFAEKESGGDVSFSYGLNLAYQISERIKIRSGLNKIALSYNIKDVNLGAAVSAVALGDQPVRTTLASPATGKLNQDFGFLEVPLEIEYLLLDRKLGMNLILGGSTFFLDDNIVSLNSSGYSTALGKANNVNELSFSTNIGLNLNYNLTPDLQFNLEPMFKYQINTFEAPGVNPYHIGLYSGFSFSF